ncbi:MAG: phosphoglucomutase/phosphomannomutase family protein [Acidobacteriota bacterium]
MTFPLGTDGWRGVIAEGCTFAAIERLSSAMAEVYRSLPEGDTRTIVVGHDTRFFSPEFARRAADTLARGGIDVLLTDSPIPTPAVSDHVRRLGLAGGIAITASHNPGEYNGFKIKSHFGGSAPPELYDEVARAASRAPVSSKRTGTVRVQDLLGPYRDRIQSRVDLDAMRGAGLSVLADSMHGAAGSLVADILSGGKTRVVPFRADRDPLFGGVHPEPIAANLHAASEKVRHESLDLAVAQDGDSDRLGVLDGRGLFVSPHKILALLLLHAYRRRGLTGGIAKTFSTSLLIDRVAASLQVPLLETPIGFKYLADLMNRGDAQAGGEESGGYAFSFHLPERDGVLNALLLIESLALSGRNLDGALEDLAAEFGEFAYGRVDVSLPVDVIAGFLAAVRREPPDDVAGEAVTGVSDLDGVKYVFGGRGWLLHRLSGTEPMVRLYCEHEDQVSVDRILEAARRRLEGFAGS